MSNEKQREWHFYAQDMIEFSKKVLAYTSNMDQTSFLSNTTVYDATLRNLELIGEAAIHIPTAVRDFHNEIPWREIIGVRNRLAHGFLSIDDDLIWNIIQVDIPKLPPALRDLKNATSKGSA
jgi:uncharacterized protein with HEPN domain